MNPNLVLIRLDKGDMVPDGTKFAVSYYKSDFERKGVAHNYSVLNGETVRESNQY